MFPLIALKRLRYPRGPQGKEYDAGQEFSALSERDAKALTLVRAAKAADLPKVERFPRKDLNAEQPSATEQEAGAPRRNYRRRDMVPEAGQE